jgi:hypothetical protein
MSLISFEVTVELTDEDTLTNKKLDKVLSELEDFLLKHPAGFDLYSSSWYSIEE